MSGKLSVGVGLKTSTLCSRGRKVFLQGRAGQTVRNNKDKWKPGDLNAAQAFGPRSRAGCNTNLPELTPTPSKRTVYNSLLFIRVSIAAINI